MVSVLHAAAGRAARKRPFPGEKLLPILEHAARQFILLLARLFGLRLRPISLVKHHVLLAILAFPRIVAERRIDSFLQKTLAEHSEYPSTSAVLATSPALCLGDIDELACQSSVRISLVHCRLLNGSSNENPALSG